MQKGDVKKMNCTENCKGKFNRERGKIGKSTNINHDSSYERQNV